MKSPLIKLVLALFVLAGVTALFLQTNRSFTPLLPPPSELGAIPTLAATAEVAIVQDESETLDEAPEPALPTALPISTLAPTFTPASADVDNTIDSEPNATPEPVIEAQAESDVLSVTNAEGLISSNEIEGTLIIPKMDLNSGIVPVPIVDNQWQIEELRQDVGLLAGGGRFPGDEKSMILAGHATTFWPIKGPFAKLPGLVPNDEIIYHYNNQKYTYKISRLIWAEPDNVNILNSDNGNQLILVTCGDYDYFVGRYDQRLVVLADLIDVKPLESTN